MRKRVCVTDGCSPGMRRKQQDRRRRRRRRPPPAQLAGMEIGAGNGASELTREESTPRESSRHRRRTKRGRGSAGADEVCGGGWGGCGPRASGRRLRRRRLAGDRLARGRTTTRRRRRRSTGDDSYGGVPGSIGKEEGQRGDGVRDGIGQKCNSLVLIWRDGWHR